MTNFLFIILVCIVVLIFYLEISKYYVGKQYVIKEIDNKSITKIRGNYIDITYNGECVHIVKKDDKWYCSRNADEIVEELIEINKPFCIEEKSFMIIEKEQRGGFFVLLPLIVTATTVLFLFLFQQENSIIDFTTENSESTQVASTIDKEDNTETEEENTSRPIIIDDNEDIHTIVMEYDDLFQNNITIDWSSYQSSEQSNGHIRYSLGNGHSETGLNATKNQGSIDWENVSADGIDFALIHIGSRLYGEDRKNGVEDIVIDSKFKENMDGAIANNIKVGTTFYSQATTKEEMDQEIEVMLEAVKDYDLDYPMGISLDRADEHRANDLSDEEYVDLIKYFCIRITEKGYTPMILGYEEWYYQFPEGTFDGYLKLVTNVNGPPGDIDNCIIWTYDETAFGEVDGVSEDVLLYLSGYCNENNSN